MNLSDPIHSVTTTLEGQVFRILAATTEGLTGSRIADLVGGRSKTGVRLALARLVEDGTVQVQAVGPSLVYTANRDHLMWPSIEYSVEAAVSVRQRLQAIIVDVLLDTLADTDDARGVTFAFFGSVARGDSSRLSDIDLLAVFPSDMAAEVSHRVADEIMRVVGRATGNVCNVYRLDSRRFDELVDSGDPMIASWRSDARTFHGPDVKNLIRVRESHSGRRPVDARI